MKALLAPLLPEYDIDEWRKKPFVERLKLVCASWALQGYGSPWGVYFVYALKIAAYVFGWIFFVGFTPGLGSLANIGEWWSVPIVFQKAVIWSMAFEAIGLGCGSGPLTGRYMPPMGGILYFLRPGTTKMPFFPGVPLIGTIKRTVLDVAIYVLYLISLFRILVAPALTIDLLLPTLILLPLAGILDKTIYLISRAEHYFAALVCFAFLNSGTDWIAGSKLVWGMVWFWAAFSKLNKHFPSVVAVMISNSPVTRIIPVRRFMYRNYPEDLRPSRLAHMMAHMGTAFEISFAPILLFSTSPQLTFYALIAMLLFHIFITSHIPMGVPIEWNVMMVYGGFVLFGAYPAISPFAIESPVLIGLLAIGLFVLPVTGNLFPHLVSFLCSMRYYAGNWAYSIWLFKGDSSRKLDEHLIKSAPRVPDQLRRFYDEDTVTAIMSKVIAFRSMHLHGRALQFLLPKAVGSFEALEDYEYLDGELVAGIVIGWNFGDGHLHNEQVLNAVQQQCQFEKGELRCIFVESQPFGRAHLDYHIVDAAAGTIDRGRVPISDLTGRQPWPAATG